MVNPEAATERRTRLAEIYKASDASAENRLNILQMVGRRSNFLSLGAFILTQRADGKTTFAERFPEDLRSIDLDDEMRDHLGYEVTLRSGCALLWEKYMSSATAYRIHIGPVRDVTVDSVVEA